jgi:ATP-dependent helicase/nuclease subunit A
LEWPVVVCHSLEQNLRGDIWGLSIVSEQTEIDLDNVLGHRWIRFWVNPYADQQKQTFLWNQLQESEAQQEATRDALQEEVRLMYVGMTRARDYLVLPTRNAAPVWLNRICNEGREDVKTLDEHTNETIGTGRITSLIR